MLHNFTYDIISDLELHVATYTVRYTCATMAYQEKSVHRCCFQGPCGGKFRCIVMSLQLIAVILIILYSAREAPLTANRHIKVGISSYNISGSLCTWMANNQCLVCAAYYDNRSGLSITPSVIVIGFRLWWSKQAFRCHMVYSNQSVVIVNATVDRIDHYIHTEYDLEPTLFVCKVPSGEVPTIFSLTTTEENVTTTQQLPFIMVKDTKPQSATTKVIFAVCLMSPLYNFGDAQALVEFFEMNRILGAEYFTVYTHSITDSVSKVLNQYVREGVVEVIDWKINTMTEGHSLFYYGQYVIMHDCLYRNMHTAKYLHFNDADEVTVPRQDKNWTQLMAKVDNPSVGSFLSKNVFYFTPEKGPSGTKLMEGFNYSMLPCPTIKVPRYYLMWLRTQNALQPGERSKCMVKPMTIYRLAVHFVFGHLPGYSTYNFPEGVAIIQHYRNWANYSNIHLPDRKMLDYAPEFMNALGKYLCVP